MHYLKSKLASIDYRFCT